jgi:hypothetical protein
VSCARARLGPLPDVTADRLGAQGLNMSIGPIRQRTSPSCAAAHARPSGSRCPTVDPLRSGPLIGRKSGHYRHRSRSLKIDDGRGGLEQTCPVWVNVMITSQRLPARFRSTCDPDCGRTPWRCGRMLVAVAYRRPKISTRMSETFRIQAEHATCGDWLVPWTRLHQSCRTAARIDVASAAVGAPSAIWYWKS